MDRKIRILMLGVDDNPAPGHALYDYQHLPADYEGCLLLKSSRAGRRELVLYPRRWQRNLKKLVYRNLWTRVQWWFRYGLQPAPEPRNREWHFKGNELIGYSARDILRRCPQGFVPDVIALYWVSGMVSARMVRQLHQLTGAQMVYVFVDEAHLTGGCHYPIDCQAWQADCADCPALRSGKRLASVQLALKKRHLQGLPLCVAATPYDLQLAARSPLFRQAVPLSLVLQPDVQAVPQAEARRRFGLSDDAFVVFMGAVGSQSRRKGFAYAVEALLQAAARLPQLTVLIAGSADDELRSRLASVHCVYTGLLAMPELHQAFCAADVFLSATIADSGPMMVNLAAALATPTVAFPVGIATTLVQHRQTGYLACLKDAADLAQGLLFMAAQPAEVRRSMGRRSQALLHAEAARGSWLAQLAVRLRAADAQPRKG